MVFFNKDFTFFINFLLECPIFATNIVDVKSINLLPAMSNIEKFSAFDQIIGSWPCIDRDSTFLSLFINLKVAGAGIFLVLIILCWFFILLKNFLFFDIFFLINFKIKII